MAGGQTSSRRRWFQFSLTSLFLLTTLVALWLAWELAFIRERQAWLRDNAALVDLDVSTSTVMITGITIASSTTAPAPLLPPPTISWWRRLLGDEAVPTITEGDNWTDDDRALVARLFPEATIAPQAGNLTFSINAVIEEGPAADIPEAQPGEPSTSEQKPE